MDTTGVPEMAAALALIVGTSLALSAALGDLVTYLTEAIKQTGYVPEGMSGLVALAIGIVLGVLVGALTGQIADTSYSTLTLMLLGAFAGMLMGASGIKSYKAAGEMNTTSAFIEGQLANQPSYGVRPLRVADDELDPRPRRV